MTNTPVHVIDDAEGVRRSIAALLESVGQLCLTYASALEFLAVVQPAWSGSIIADVRMPAMTGIELIRELRLRGVRMPVIIITAHADVPMAVAALKEGAADFIEKPFRDETLLASLKAAKRAEQQGGVSSHGALSSAGMDALSPREREVMLLLIAGHSNKSVASRLGISARTVELHRAHVMEKTGARSLSELVRMACLSSLA